MDSLSAYNFTEPKDCTLQNVIEVMEKGETSLLYISNVRVDRFRWVDFKDKK